MTRQFFRWLGGLAGRYPGVALPLVAVLTALAAWAAATRLEIEMDVAGLLPEDSDLYQERLAADDLFGGGNYDFLLVALELREDAPVSVREEGPEYLRSIKPEVLWALYDPRYFTNRHRRVVQGEVRTRLARIDAQRVALLDDRELDWLESRIFPETLDNTLAEFRAELGDAPTTETLRRLQADPFGVGALLDRQSQFLSGPLKNYWQPQFNEETGEPTGSGYYISDDGQMLLFALWPAKPSTNLVKARELMLFIEQTREGLYERNPDWRDAVLIEFAGPHVENAEGTTDVREDMLLTSLTSLAAVLFLFVVAFRQPEALVFVAVPLVVGVIWTLGLTSFFVERVTQVTLTFAAILIGLGIDFSIHLYNRYLEDLRLGHGAEEALENAMYLTGPSIVAGAITTGFGFFGMALTRFEGFRELGLFGGIGIFMCLLAVAVTLPPLMIFSARFSRRVHGPLATLGLKTVTFTVQSYPRMTVAAGLCVVAFLGLHATRATFDDDFATLRQLSDDYTALLDRIDTHFDLPTNQVLVIVESESRQGSLGIDDRIFELNDRVFRNIMSTEGTYRFIGVDSGREVFPSAETQANALERFASVDLERIRGRLQAFASDNPSLPPGYFGPFLADMESLRDMCRRALASGQPPIGLTQLIADPDLYQVFLFFFGKDETRDVYRAITHVYPPPADIWMEGIPDLFERRLGEGLPERPIVLGNAILSLELRQLIIRDLSVIVLIVFFSVSIYLSWYFRSIVRAGLAIIPTVFGLLCMLGVMHLAGLSLNYLNIIAIPMIVGIGVDSAIHLLGRFYEGEKHDMRLAIERTGRAIVVTGLTTLFGFGALSFASFRGIREIGFLSIAGVGFTLFAALIFLPAVLKLLDPDFTYRGGPGDEIG